MLIWQGTKSFISDSHFEFQPEFLTKYNLEEDDSILFENSDVYDELAALPDALLLAGYVRQLF